MIDWGGLVDIFYLPSIPDVDTFQKVEDISIVITIGQMYPFYSSL